MSFQIFAIFVVEIAKITLKIITVNQSYDSSEIVYICLVLINLMNIKYVLRYNQRIFMFS